MAQQGKPQNISDKGVMNTIRNENTQRILINNLKKVIENTKLGRPGVPYNARVANTNSALIPYKGSPEEIVNKMCNPPRVGEFINATPAQLSVLEPLLRFFIVDKAGNEEEVYFSDHTTEERLLKIASLKRAKSLDSVLKPRSQTGAQVGVKSFTWNYNNKHEGDYIIDATMELYFGTLAELVNVNYLQFLFTNGRKNTMANGLEKNKKNQSLSDRLRQKKEELEEREKFLKQGVDPKAKSALDATLEKDKDDFRTLKVMVGWSVPKGNRRELRKLFENDDAKMKNFLKGVSSTNRMISLNLTNYQVNFSQDGPTTLTLSYKGSSDRYISNNKSDVFGSYNEEDGINKELIQVQAANIEEDKILPNGYIREVMKAGKITALAQGSETPTTYEFTLNGIKAEISYLSEQIEYAKLRNSQSGNKVTDTSEFKTFKQYSEAAENVYKLAQENARAKRYKTLMEKITDSGRVFVAYASFKKGRLATTTPKDLWKIDVDFTKPKVNKNNSKFKVLQGAAERVSTAGLEAQDFAKFLEESNVLDPTSRASYEGDDAFMPIFFIRLGDLIKAAMENAQMRDDIKIVLGTFAPDQLNIPGYGSLFNPGIPESLYDLPISLDYYLSWFAKNVVARNIDAWPFRRFLDDTLHRLVAPLLNFTTNTSNSRLFFDYTLYQTQNPLPERIFDQSDLETYQDNLSENVNKRNLKLLNYYVLYAKQIQFTPRRRGDRIDDERDGIYHYIVGADRGVVKNFNFAQMDVPQYKAMVIERSPSSEGYAQALVLPQNVSIDMFGNTLHRNGDMIFVNSQAALGPLASEILMLGGYYRVYRSTHTIDSAGFSTTIDCKFERRARV